MMLALCLVLQLCVLVASQKTGLDSPENLFLLRTLRKLSFTIFGGTDEYRRASPESRWRMQPEVPPHVPFLCNVTGGRSPVVPDSVHRLRPGDIDVIGALGDSLTSGYGALASNILDFPIDYRGVAATIGGQGNWRTYLTVPNILKEYNPNLIGYGLGTSLAFEEAAQLNVAEDGAISRDMPFMAKYLIRKMRRDPRIDIRKHWKLIYIFIGHNDICTDSCYVPRILDVVENHRTDLIETLRILKNNLPRTLVNIIMTANLKTLSEEANERRTLECYFLPRVECPCLFGLPHQHRRAEIYDVLRRFHEVEMEVIRYPEFNSKDFTVVSSPIVSNSYIPRTCDGRRDLSYFSIDCFHISQKTNAMFANGLWNNLLEPIDNKTDSWGPLFEKFLCPTPERPFIVTRENSQMMFGTS